MSYSMCIGDAILTRRAWRRLAGAAIVLVVAFVEGCYDKKKVCLVERVEWVGVVRNDGLTNLEIGVNPANRGGGDRIFPGRNHPTGAAGIDDLHDRVRIRATLSATSPPTATVFFRLFDMDHYSADTTFDPNGATEAEDNVRARDPLTIDVGAELRTTDFSSAAASAVASARVATLGLQINRLQPGNNWRVACHCSAKLLEPMVVGPDGQTLKETPVGADWPTSKQTPLLTVWRWLHAEIDRMNDPILNVGTGQSRFDAGAAARTGANSVQPTLPGTGIIASQTNQFQGGRVRLLKADNSVLGTLGVDANTTGMTPTLTTVQAVPNDVAKFEALEDDDINNTSASKVDDSGDMAPMTDLWPSRLEPALVIPKFDTPEVVANNNDDGPFDVHIGDDATNATERATIRTLIGSAKGSSSEAGFWLIHQLGAFQGRQDEEGDRDDSAVTLGVSSLFSQPPNDTQAGTIVYAETSRDGSENRAGILTDVDNLLRASSIHEAGHEFGMVDGPTHGPLMNGPDIFAANTLAAGAALQFNGAGFRQIMLTERPGHDPQ